MDCAQQIVGKQAAPFTDHRRRAKAKLYKINNVSGDEARYPFYLELIRVTRETVQDAQALVPLLEKYQSADLIGMLRVDAARGTLETYIPLAKQVIDQAYRRIVKKEQVPVAEKIVSIFEPHTDIIVKGFRDVVFGHKVMLSTGASGMLLTLNVLDGNPKDSTLVPETLAKLKELYAKAPLALAFDGCFASAANRDLIKAAGVEDLTFSKNGSLDLATLLTSPKIHRALRNFRAGVEGCISFLKRVFGFSRVLDKGKETFAAALQMSAFAYNLTLLARMRLAAKSSA
jgi:IS5 family transposase